MSELSDTTTTTNTKTIYKSDYLTESKNVVGVYNEIAHHFKDTRAYKWHWIETFMKQYEDTTSVIYDIGCGSGRNLRTPTQTTMNMIGVDNCDAFIDMCRDEGKTVVKGCMTKIPLESSSGDAVICIAAFHHLVIQERRIQALQEMKRILKPHSKILISVWSIIQPKKTRRTFAYGDNLVPWNKDGVIYQRYYYIFTITELEELFTNAGLKIVDHNWDCGNEVYILET